MKQRYLTLPSLLLGTLLVSGCATQTSTLQYPDQQPQTLAKKWASPQDTSAQSFNQTTTLTSSLLTLFNDDALAALVQKSQTKNLLLLQQKHTSQALASELLMADGALNPELSTNLNSRRQGVASDTSQSHALTLDVSWELDVWGKLASEQDAAKNDYLSSTLTYQWLQDSIAAQTMQAYVDAVSQSKLVKLGEEKTNSFEKSLSVVRAQYQAGTAELDDLTLARQNLASAQGDIYISQLSMRTALRTLQLLVGEYPDAQDLVGTQLPNMMPAPNAELPANTLSRRPDVQASWYSLKSQYASVSAAQAAKLPSINLTTQLGTSSNALKNILSGDILWDLAASIGYTLFDSGVLEAQISAQKSLSEASYFAYLQTVMTALNEVENALDTEQSYHQYEAAQRQVVKQASLILVTAEQDYRDGLIDMTDWLSFKRSYFDEQSTLINTVNTRLQNRISLGLALGLGL